MAEMFDRVAIIGLGLLGGSLARAMREKVLVRYVVGCGRTAGRLEYALNNGIADSVTSDPVEAVRGADFIVISTPVGMIPEVIERIAPHVKPGAVITDVGSTKQLIVECAERALPAGIHFVGSHPMAGSENAGVEASSATLFENALCVVTSSARTEVSALNLVGSLWESLKCRVMVMSPGEHDRLVAAASHLPHLAAVALCRAVESVSLENEKVVPLLAGGFRDTTRVASGSPEVWRDICLANGEHIRAMLESYIYALTEIRDILSHDAPDKIEEAFALAKKFRDEAPWRGIGALESDFEVIVDVVDRPGVMGEVASALGGASINIKNMNIRQVREMGGGALLLALEKEEDIEAAIKILEKNGFAAKAR